MTTKQEFEVSDEDLDNAKYYTVYDTVDTSDEWSMISDPNSWEEVYHATTKQDLGYRL